jgi:hypothetical protein
MAQAFRNVMGREATPTELQYAQAVAWLETNYGQGWKGAMVGSNNWGAVQCGKTATGTCIQYQDSRADGTKYSVGFRAYPSAVAGAEDVVRHVFQKRPKTASALASSTPSAYRASYAMRRERYYEGFCPNATKKYGSEPARASLANPDRDEGTRACMQEAVEAHSKLTGSLSREIAAANADPAPLPPGDFKDADDWWGSVTGAVTGAVKKIDRRFPAAKFMVVGVGASLGYLVVSRYVKNRKG